MNCKIEDIVSFKESNKNIESLIYDEINKKRSFGSSYFIDSSIIRVLKLSANIKFKIVKK